MDLDKSQGAFISLSLISASFEDTSKTYNERTVFCNIITGFFYVFKKN